MLTLVITTASISWNSAPATSSRSRWTTVPLPVPEAVCIIGTNFSGSTG